MQSIYMSKAQRRTPRITHWYGRLGNNIQQIMHGLFYCIHNHKNFTMPPHDLIDNIELIYGKRCDGGIKNSFFYCDEVPLHERGTQIARLPAGERARHLQPHFPCDTALLAKKRRDICIGWIAPKLRIPYHNPISDDTLVIHLRSGDVFNNTKNNNAPPFMVPNPAAYYTKIMAPYRKVLVVAEDLKHPLIKWFKRHKKVTIQSSSLALDFATLMAASHLASSGAGTFCIAAALCSKNIRKFYASDRYVTSTINPTSLQNNTAGDIDVEIIELPGYIEIGEWCNSQPQWAEMFHYSLEDGDNE